MTNETLTAYRDAAAAAKARADKLPADEHWERGGPFPNVTVITCVDAGCGSGYGECPEPPTYEPVLTVWENSPSDYTTPPPQRFIDIAEFVAHGKQDIPTLADAVDELCAEVERLQREIAECHEALYEDDT